jgi:hypothetical protein
MEMDNLWTCNYLTLVDGLNNINDPRICTGERTYDKDTLNTGRIIRPKLFSFLTDPLSTVNAPQSELGTVPFINCHHYRSTSESWMKEKNSYPSPTFLVSIFTVETPTRNDRRFASSVVAVILSSWELRTRLECSRISLKAY